MPPAVFPPILGLLGLGLALRRALAATGLPVGIADLALGLAAGLWLLAAGGYLRKLSLRPGVLAEDLKPLPGRTGLAAGSVAGMAAAVALAPHAPGAAAVAALALMALHAGLAVAVLATLRRLPAEGRGPAPALHLVLVGFIVGALALAVAGQDGLARGVLYAMIPVAGAIWALGLWQLVRRPPPAPLRPMLAIHLAPAALFATVAAETGLPALAQGFAALALLILVALVAGARWIAAAGVSPMWGALTFPLAAAAGALLAQGGAPATFGLAVTLAALALIPWIAWRVLRMWPTGKLAEVTNAAEA
jgi:tellurite resistance protein